MDSIGIAQPLLVKAPAPVTPLAHVVAVDAAQASQVPKHTGESFSAQAAEKNRAETVQKLSQQIANVYVVGDQTFSLFKDGTGQYITRFTSLRDGKVTYIPEPSLFKLGGSSENGGEPLVKIQA